MRVPAYIVGGWFDLFLGNTLNSFVGARREGGSELIRQQHRLLVGPWGHGSIYGAYPDHSFAEFEGRGVPVKDGRWGYRLLVVEDLDGNQLFFPYPNEPA